MSISTIESHLTHPSTPKTGNTDCASKKVTFEDQAPLIPNLSHDTKSTSPMIPKNPFMESLDAPSPMVETVHSDEESNKNNDTFETQDDGEDKEEEDPDDDVIPNNPTVSTSIPVNMIGDDISVATSIKNPDPDNPLRIMLIPDKDHQQKWVKKYGTLVTETRKFFIEQENNMGST